MGLTQPLAEGAQNDWLLLPAWQFGRHLGVKLVSVFPDNEARGVASIQGLYVLFDGDERAAARLHRRRGAHPAQDRGQLRARRHLSGARRMRARC